MGNYLNTVTAYDAYLKEYNSPYFVDKSPMLEELIARIDTGTNYICIIRPRRFGKSVMANMIASFFSRECNAGPVFSGLRIADSKPCWKATRIKCVKYLNLPTTQRRRSLTIITRRS